MRSIPRFAPALMPDTTTSGGSVSRSSTASTTQSAGVPFVAHAGRSRPGSEVRVARSGLCSVIAWLAALRSCSGATTNTVAARLTARASATSPGDAMPSSLVRRTRSGTSRPAGRALVLVAPPVRRDILLLVSLHDGASPRLLARDSLAQFFVLMEVCQHFERVPHGLFDLAAVLQ